MPKIPLHALVWSEDQRLYEWYTHGQIEQRFQSEEDTRWLAWLSDAATSFTFRSSAGALNVYRERRQRGGSYWYAYHTSLGKTHKRYLGQTENLTLARLEETAQALAHHRSHERPHAATFDSQPTLGVELLAMKLVPPHLPGALVTRERLLTALDGALSTPLTLLAAPAGWGKTTLLAAWAIRQSRQGRQSQSTAHVAWLSLDELDNIPTRFWVAMIAALRECGGYAPNLGASALAMLQSPQPPALPTMLTALLHDMERVDGHEAEAHRSPTFPAAPVAPVILIVDDCQVIGDQAIHESLRFFLEHLPADVRLILSSRVDPELPLARLRARGRLTEIRMDDLRFDLDEACDFLQQMLSQPLTDDEAQQLTRRTEGWAAGLQLAALALQKRADHADHADRSVFLQAMTGSQRYLLDYVQEDILAQLPANIRAFLLPIAVLSRLDAEACQVVTGEPDRRVCQQMLEALERANLFLVPLDEERRWYRLHDLFREALLAALEQTQPDRAPELHRRAARYYESQEKWAEAIVHRLAVADFEPAAQLMEQVSEQFWERGEVAMMAPWVLALPQQVVRRHARLALRVAVYLLNTVTYAAAEPRARTHTEVRQLMARVEATLPPQRVPADGGASGAGDAVSRAEERAHAGPVPATPTDSATAGEQVAHIDEAVRLRRHLRALHLDLEFVEAAARGEFERLRRMQLEIQELQDALDHDEDEEAIWQLLLLSSTFALHYYARHEGALMLPRLLGAKERVRRSGSHFATFKVMQYLVVAAFDAGQLRLAYEESLGALHLIEQIPGYVVLRGYFELVRIEVLYEWNRLEEVRSRLHAVLRDPVMRQHLDVLGGGYLALLRVELARADWPGADEALRGLEDLVRGEGFGTYPGVLPALRAMWFLARGQVADAAAWAADVAFHEGAWEISLYFDLLTVIRTHFAQRRWQEALELLERWGERLDRPGNIGITILFQAQLLAALHQAGQSERARQVAARLFALTEPEGYLRIYVDTGEPMRQALLALQAGHDHNPPRDASIMAYIARLLAAFDQRQQGARRSLEATPHTSAPSSGPHASTAYPLAGPRADMLLTRRELEVLRLLADGVSNQEIAQTLMIELSTVKKHVSNLLGKLNATSRTQAIARARARSLL